MQRQIIHGVPYFTDVQNRLYTWEPDGIPCHIGIYDPIKKTVEFLPNHQAILEEKLTTWRRNQHTRSRKPVAPSDAESAEAEAEADAAAESVDPETDS